MGAQQKWLCICSVFKCVVTITSRLNSKTKSSYKDKSYTAWTTVQRAFVVASTEDSYNCCITYPTLSMDKWGRQVEYVTYFGITLPLMGAPTKWLWYVPVLKCVATNTWCSAHIFLPICISIKGRKLYPIMDKLITLYLNGDYLSWNAKTCLAMSKRLWIFNRVTELS